MKTVRRVCVPEDDYKWSIKVSRAVDLKLVGVSISRELNAFAL
jgi:hypothetical protein